MAPRIGLLLLGIAALVDSHVVASGIARPLRAAAPRMAEFHPDTSSWPPPLDAVHVFSVPVSFTSSNKIPLALAQVSNAKAAALLSLWKVNYEFEEDQEMVSLMLAGARPGASPGEEPSAMTFGAYLDGADGDEHGIVLVRFDHDANVMILDAVLASPSLPQQRWPPVHAAINGAIGAIGEAHGMSVRPWTDYDV